MENKHGTIMQKQIEAYTLEDLLIQVHKELKPIIKTNMYIKIEREFTPKGDDYSLGSTMHFILTYELTDGNGFTYENNKKNLYMQNNSMWMPENIDNFNEDGTFKVHKVEEEYE